MQMKLSGHMAYDSTPADKESAFYDEDFNAPVTIGDILSSVGATRPV